MTQPVEPCEEQETTMDITRPKSSKMVSSRLYGRGRRVVASPAHVVARTAPHRPPSPAQHEGVAERQRNLRRARELAQDSAEIRAEKVDAARRALQNGTLNLNSEDLADALMRHILPLLNDTPPRR
jgi:flagellar biosynthesis anti-sigma factor FlgM